MRICLTNCLNTFLAFITLIDYIFLYVILCAYLYSIGALAAGMLIAAKAINIMVQDLHHLQLLNVQTPYDPLLLADDAGFFVCLFTFTVIFTCLLIERCLLQRAVSQPVVSVKEIPDS